MTPPEGRRQPGRIWPASLKQNLRFLRVKAERLYTQTERAIMMVIGGIGFGDIALVPGPTAKTPQGIRDIDGMVHEHGDPPGLHLQSVRTAVRGRAGKPAQDLRRGGRPGHGRLAERHRFRRPEQLLHLPQSFRDLYKPFYKQVNDWIHRNTPWKTFIHSCGSIQPIIPDIIDSGFDILNPVQTSAANMDPQALKAALRRPGDFWGGGVDTQHTLPFGTPRGSAPAGAPAAGDLRPGRRLRFRHRSQRPGQGAGRKPAGDVPDHPRI